jgi:hypothetical protein
MPKDGAPAEDGLKKRAKRGKGKKAKRKSKMKFASPQSLVEIRFWGLWYLGGKGLRLKILSLFALSPFPLFAPNFLRRADA